MQVFLERRAGRGGDDGAALSAAVAPLGKSCRPPSRHGSTSAAPPPASTKRQTVASTAVPSIGRRTPARFNAFSNSVDDGERFADVLFADLDQHAERRPAQVQRRQALRVGDGGEPGLDADAAPTQTLDHRRSVGFSRLTEA